MKNDTFGNRMKEYESVSKNFLIRRMPVILRLDGKAFHSFTRGFQKPFDVILMESMWETTKYLCENVMNCKMAYTQSDEISLLLIDYDNIQTQPWFNNSVQKMTSISASMATMAFNKIFSKCVKGEYYYDIGFKETYLKRIDTAMFDSRVFNIPKDEVVNYFIWREQDATRNSIQMVGQANFSHKQLHGKNCNQIQEMLFQEKDLNFNDLPAYQKRGVCCVKVEKMCSCSDNENFQGEILRKKWIIDKDIPIFTQDREYINKFI